MPSPSASEFLINLRRSIIYQFLFSQFLKPSQIFRRTIEALITLEPLSIDKPCNHSRNPLKPVYETGYYEFISQKTLSQIMLK
jgi:hypothetical protein